jgi:hypothetical protein
VGSNQKYGAEIVANRLVLDFEQPADSRRLMSFNIVKNPDLIIFAGYQKHDIQPDGPTTPIFCQYHLAAFCYRINISSHTGGPLR